MSEIVPKPKSKFLKIKCTDCENEQIIFEKASNLINCLVCGSTLAKPTGGKSLIKGEILGELE